MNHWISYANTFPKGDPRSIAFQRTSNKFVSDVIHKFDHTSRVNGLLFGQVQSGKTTHTFSIIAATADGDPGFRTFIYLTSNSTQLQQQTYGDALERLNQTFEVSDTVDEIRFKKNYYKPNLIILNKDPNILKKWIAIIRADERTAEGPIFIVDDEGDAASQNTKVNSGEISTIHSQIKQLRDMGTGSIYLQVTATPQALFLQSAISEEKPKFIHYFEPGTEYLGGDFFFGSEDTTTHKNIDEQDIDDLIRTNKPSEGIRRTLASFICVTAYFKHLGRANANCLIHPHYSRASHVTVANVASDYLKVLLAENVSGEDKRLLEDALTDLNQKLTPTFSQEEFWGIHRKGIDISTRIINADNKMAEEEYKTGFNVVVGANAIGRGVAFPHLQTVYYARKANVPQADTFWQHSRIFGYDRDWTALRIFMPPSLFRLFRVLQDQNSRLIEMIKNGERDLLQIPLGAGVRPTRANVIDKARYRFIVGGTNYFPPFPNQENARELDKIFEEYGESYTDPIDLDSVKKVIRLASASSADWKAESFIKAIDREIVEPKCMLLLRRGRKISTSTGSMLSPNDRQYGEQLRDQLVITAYRVDGEAGKWSESKDFWMINVKLPGSLFYHEVE